ncbi:MAG: NAD-dependent malic enzyme [Chloroflexi bacterium ADurb.Bin325]|nr:MAG: NAD-dependent malic enzyme [Chloroflexi bacterium ADurb.Bin325]
MLTAKDARIGDPSNVQELLARAQKPSVDAMRLHPFYRGKIEVVPKACIRSLDDFAIWYTPGVAAPCRAIERDPELVYEHTNKWNTIAVVSDGTRVLGLGDIGPKAGLPVMEGKALLFKYLGGVDAVPIMLDTKDPDEIIRTVLLLQPAFGGVNLEDIAQPKCFRILDTLRERAEIPVWHDDQQGTACVTVAALLNALKIVGKALDEVKIVFLGCGASIVAITRLCFAIGVDPAKCIVVDSCGILNEQRTDIFSDRERFAEKWKLCQITNAAGNEGSAAEALIGADVCIALSQPGPGTLPAEWVREMAHDAIVFACANPVPEIWPWEAAAAGARIVATGRSDFPNQVNNSLGFPGIFRGALDVRATTITDEMCIAAAQALAAAAPDGGLNPECILPPMTDWEVYAREAVAVGMKAQEQGVARLSLTEDELFGQAADMILRARRLTETMMETDFIPSPPGA